MLFQHSLAMSSTSDISHTSPTTDDFNLALQDSSPNGKKRRRSRKGLQKVFECEEPGCGKNFTRMEHLARHQLNRMSK